MPEFRSAKPSWSLQQSAPQLVAAGNSYLTWNVVTFEDPVGFDGLSSYVVDRPGLYLLGAQTRRDAIAVGSTVALRFTVNTVVVTTHQVITTTAQSAIALSYVQHLEAGDAVAVLVTFSTTIAANTSIAHTRFWGARIGPKRWT